MPRESVFFDSPDRTVVSKKFLGLRIGIISVEDQADATIQTLAADRGETINEEKTARRRSDAKRAFSTSRGRLVPSVRAVICLFGMDWWMSAPDSGN
jgi:hypothetical protein